MEHNHDMPGMIMTTAASAMEGMNHTGMNQTGINNSGMGGMTGMGDMTGMGGMDNNGMTGMGMNMNNSGMMMMAMYFHDGFKEYILLEDLHTQSKGAFAGACVVVFILGVLYEMLKFWREDIQRHYMMRVSHVLNNGSSEEKAKVTSSVHRMFSGPHLLQTLLHACQIFLSYCLMLLFMTYNVYLCLCIVLGAAVGYFVVGWKRTRIMDGNEHCH